MNVLSPTFQGVSLEQEVHKLEESLVMQALMAANGSLLEATRYLHLRSEDALKFILRRHPKLYVFVVTAPEKNDQGQDHKGQLIVAALVQ